MEEVTVSIGKAKYKTTIQMGKHSAIADEPEDLGGTDQGPMATELLLGSLGTCTAITLRMYADRKEWPLDGVDVKLSLEKQTEKGSLSTSIKRVITLKGNLDEDQKKRMMLIADKCPVHKVLSNPIAIHSELV